MDIEKYSNYKLCYVDNEDYQDNMMTLYFTELQDISKQWGDDWGDRPYEHNAGTPYEYDYDAPEQGVENGKGIYPKIDIFKVVIDSYNIITPRHGHLNSPYSVEDINKGVIPWLTITTRDDKVIFIQAGTSLKEVMGIFNEHKDIIQVYVEYR